MKKVVLGLLLIGLLVLIPVVGAQAVVRFNSVQIQFWPEYDQPEMLVIYTFELPAEQSLPVEMSVRIPSRVGAPTAVAVLDGGRLVTQDYSLSDEGDWTLVTLTTGSPVIHLEYYDPALSQSDQPRSFSFEWSFDYPVDQVAVTFKQPATASDVVLSTDLGAPESGDDGLETYSASLGALPAGEAFSFSIEYQKADNLLSAEPPAPPSAQTDSSQGVSSPQSQFPSWGWYIIGVGALILAGGGMYLWYINTPTAFSSYRQKKARSSTSRSGGKKGSFCHQCGAQADRGDKFCRECGQKLRN